MNLNLKRAFKLHCNTWRERLERLRLWYERRTCPHSFRPARVNDQPGRFCSICEKTEELTPEEFFAQFGEHIWQR
jgi:hypothetical protein